MLRWRGAILSRAPNIGTEVEGCCASRTSCWAPARYDDLVRRPLALVLSLVLTAGSMACGRLGFGEGKPVHDASELPTDDGAATSDASLADGASDGAVDPPMDSGQMGVCSGGGCTCALDCTRGCPGGDCAMICDLAATCSFSCDGGGCAFTASSVATAQVTCLGGDCTFSAVLGGEVSGTCTSGCSGGCAVGSSCGLACGANACPCTGGGCR